MLLCITYRRTGCTWWASSMIWARCWRIPLSAPSRSGQSWGTLGRLGRGTPGRSAARMTSASSFQSSSKVAHAACMYLSNQIV